MKEIINTESIVFVDLETIPSNEKITKEDLRNALPANVTKEETILKKLTEEKEVLEAKIVKQRSINRYECKIAVLAYSIDGDTPVSFMGTEKDILQHFNNALKSLADELGTFHKIAFCGHNGKKFDFPILYLKACKYGTGILRDSLFFARQNKKLYDTMEMGTYWQYSEYVSLKDLCWFFGRKSKDGIDGSQVYKYWKEGKKEEVAQYCCRDVEDTVFLFNKLNVFDLK